MGRFEDLDQIADAVPADSPWRVLALDLRDAGNAKRLGVNVRERIAAELDGRGIGFFPGEDLPDWQEDVVYLYRKDSPLGTLIRAVKDPTERGLKALTEAARKDRGATREYDELDEALSALQEAAAAIRKVLGRDEPQ